MSVLKMYDDFRNNFPRITNLADSVHIQEYGEVDPHYAYSWFKSLAIAINEDMNKGLNNVESYKATFKFLRNNYLTENYNIQNCIDNSFISNLFWQVNSDKFKKYWVILPIEFQNKFIDLNGCKPF